MTGRVAVIIPNYNRADLLRKVLADLRPQTLQPAEVIVVDNGSKDGSTAVASAAGAKVISLQANLGFCRAVNEGIRESAAADWVAIINNDVELEPTWLEELMAAAADGERWFATGKILDLRNRTRLDGAFDAVSLAGCAWRGGNGKADGALWNEKREIGAASFTAALFRRRLFDEVGLLDEVFGSYLEDVEFGIRCAIGGYRGVYVPTAVAYHHGSATLGRWSGVVTRQISRNQLLLVARCYPSDWMRRVGWKVFIGQSLWGLTALFNGAGWAWLRGKWDGIAAFRENRRVGSPKVLEMLRASEGEIRRLQSATGYDLYWRLYFRLT